MRLHNIDGNGATLDVNVEDRSYRRREIMGEDALYLYFSHPTFVSIAVGTYADFEGSRYYLLQPDNFKKHHSRNYQFTLILESAQAGLGKYKLRDVAEGLLKFPMTAKPQQHLQMLVDNLNSRETGWNVGTCIDAAEKLISYNHTNLSEALQMIAEAFDTEWEIASKTIHLKKVEYNKTAPLNLSYGKGHGFKPGVGRTNADEKGAVEVLFVQGGSRNIDQSKYGAKELLLPKAKLFTYEGREYVTSADGRSIQRNDKPIATGTEDSLDCSHIYPSRVGTVSQSITVDADKHLYDFIDSSIPAALDYNTCQMNGEKMTVVFQSGMLAGREFEIHRYDHTTKRFQIVEQKEDGLYLPDETFKPRAGDTYAIFGVQLPDAYIREDSTQTGASWDMVKEAVKYLYENEDPRFTFTGELDGIWAKKDWLNIGGKLVLGGYVNFSDTHFQPSGVLIRIVGIKEKINNTHSPELELSNVTVGGSVISELNKIKENEVTGEDLHHKSISFTKRRFRSAQETIEMLSEAVDGFSSGVNPISVQTMSLLVGEESLQFRFVSGKTNPVEIIHNIAFDNATKKLSADGGWMQHMTIGITELKAGAQTYKYWNVSPFTSPALVTGSKPYYFYIKASKTAETATFVLSETAIKMEAVSGYYHFLVGFLNSEVAAERTFASMHGFSEVLPGRISTSKVHADTVEVTSLLAQNVYASGAKIGGVDIDPADIATNGITGLRLGNLVTFSPTSGRSGIMFGAQGGSYKMFIGNHDQHILYDGSNLFISGHALLGDGTTIDQVTELNRYFEVVNKGQANEYIRLKSSLSADGGVRAYGDNGQYPPSLWEAMPIAGADLLGAVKVGTGLKVDANGLLSVDGQLGGVSSWSDLTNKPTWLSYSTLAAFEGGHGHTWSKITGKPTAFPPAAHNHDANYLGKTAKAADSDKLDGLNSSNFMRTVNHNGYFGMARGSDGNVNDWIRTTTNGIIPYASGGASSLGTSSWNFNSIYGKTIYENNVSLASRYLGKTAKAADSDKLDGLNSSQFLSRTHYNTNIDTLTSDIIITNHGGTLQGTIPNGGHNGRGVIHMNNHDGDYYSQLMMSSGDDQLFYRSKSASPWKSWKTIYHTGNADGLIGGLNYAKKTSNENITGSWNYSNNVSVNAANGRGFRFWNSDGYKIYMSSYSDGTWGGRRISYPNGVGNDYNMYFRMSDEHRGFVFGYSGNRAQTHIVGGHISTQRSIYAGEAIISSRYGFKGSYDSNQVQGIWSIGDNWKINTSGNDFGNQYGMVYSHTNAGSTGIGGKKAITGWGHQVLFVNNGYTKVAISSEYGHILAAGNITAKGEVTAYSDRRLKSDIQPLKKRGELNPVTYIKDGKKSIGFIAQDVQKIYPELVSGKESENEYLSVNYGQMTAVLYAEISELKKEVAELKSKKSIWQKALKYLRIIR